MPKLSNKKHDESIFFLYNTRALVECGATNFIILYAHVFLHLALLTARFFFEIVLRISDVNSHDRGLCCIPSEPFLCAVEYCGLGDSNLQYDSESSKPELGDLLT